jgi:ABC-type multidrug transport system fused ATPase/permease subunit
MASVSISVAVGVLTFGVGLLGLYLKRLVPERHMSAGSREMIGAMIGLLTLLLALVLGTLIGSAYGFFASQKAEIESLCAQTLELDLAFRQYGPETQPLREALKGSMQEASDAIRGDRAAYQRHFEFRGYMSKFEKWNQTLSSLSPRSPTQTALISTLGASSASFQQTRLLMSLQLASPISWPLIVIVVSWAMLLFFGFGVTSGLNLTSLGALTFGSFAVASAIFLILELNQPYSGIFRVPSASIENTIAALDESPGS